VKKERRLKMNKTDVQNKVNDERNKIIQIITELFDERLEEYISTDIISTYILDEKRKDEDLKITIHTFMGKYIWDLTFTTLLEKLCFQKRLGGLIKKQIRYVGEFNLRDIIHRLATFQVSNYENIVSDVINNSKKFDMFIDSLKNKGFDVEIKPDKKYIVCVK
jgi:hypothetical protein